MKYIQAFILISCLSQFAFAFEFNEQMGICEEIAYAEYKQIEEKLDVKDYYRGSAVSSIGMGVIAVAPLAANPVGVIAVGTAVAVAGGVKAIVYVNDGFHFESVKSIYNLYREARIGHGPVLEKMIIKIRRKLDDEIIIGDKVIIDAINEFNITGQGCEEDLISPHFIKRKIADKLNMTL